MRTEAMAMTFHKSFSWNELIMSAFDFPRHFTLISAQEYLYICVYNFIFRRDPFMILGKGTGTPFCRR